MEINLVTIDGANESDRICRKFWVMTQKRLKVLGLAGTPQRTDKVGLHEIIERVVHHHTIEQMIRAGYLCNLRGLQVQLDVDFTRLKTHHGDYSELQLEQVLLAQQAPLLVVQAWQEYAEGRQTLVFTPTVAVACRLQHHVRRGLGQARPRRVAHSNPTVVSLP